MPTFTVVFLSKRISSSSVAYFKYFSPTTRRLDQSLTLTHTARLLVWWYTENIPSSPPQYRNRWLSILHSSVNDIELTLSSDFFFFLLQRLRRLETRSKKANITGRRIFYLKRGRGEKFQWPFEYLSSTAIHHSLLSFSLCMQTQKYVSNLTSCSFQFVDASSFFWLVTCCYEEETAVAGCKFLG